LRNLPRDLETLLAQGKRLVSQEGTLLKNMVIELARKLDPGLVRLLLWNDRIAQRFFTEAVSPPATFTCPS
jgi:hypothetical protein